MFMHPGCRSNNSTGCNWGLFKITTVNGNFFKIHFYIGALMLNVLFMNNIIAYVFCRHIHQIKKRYHCLKR